MTPDKYEARVLKVENGFSVTSFANCIRFTVKVTWLPKQSNIKSIYYEECSPVFLVYLWNVELKIK